MPRSRRPRQATTTTYLAHPLADEFPMMSDEMLAMLAADITVNGQYDPIMRCEYIDAATGELQIRIADGRNRQKACEMAGVEPRYAETILSADSDVAAYIIAHGIYRRDMTTGQKAMVMANIYKDSPGRGDEHRDPALIAFRSENFPTETATRPGRPRISIDAFAVALRRARLIKKVCDALPEDSPLHSLPAQVKSGEVKFYNAYKKVDDLIRADNRPAERMRELRQQYPQIADALDDDESMTLAQAEALAREIDAEQTKLAQIAEDYPELAERIQSGALLLAEAEEEAAIIQAEIDAAEEAEHPELPPEITPEIFRARLVKAMTTLNELLRLDPPMDTGDAVPERELQRQLAEAATILSDDQRNQLPDEIKSSIAGATYAYEQRDRRSTFHQLMPALLAASVQTKRALQIVEDHAERLQRIDQRYFAGYVDMAILIQQEAATLIAQLRARRVDVPRGNLTVVQNNQDRNRR